MIANAAITLGDAVCIDVTKGGATGEAGYGNYVVKANQGASATAFAVGIATSAAASGDIFEIQVGGYSSIAKLLDQSDANGDLLTASSTDGNLTITSEAEDGPALALLLVESGNNNTADTKVFLLNPANL